MLLPSPIQATREREIAETCSLDGEQIGHDLAGVEPIGQPVDDRDGRE